MSRTVFYFWFLGVVVGLSVYGTMIKNGSEIKEGFWWVSLLLIFTFFAGAFLRVRDWAESWWPFFWLFVPGINFGVVLLCFMLPRHVAAKPVPPPVYLIDETFEPPEAYPEQTEPREETSVMRANPSQLGGWTYATWEGPSLTSIQEEGDPALRGNNKNSC